MGIFEKTQSPQRFLSLILMYCRAEEARKECDIRRAIPEESNNAVMWCKSCHTDAVGSPYRHGTEIGILQTVHIDTEMVGRHPFAVKRVDATCAAKIMLCGMGVELVFRESVIALEQFEIVFMDFDHQCIFLSADGTITSGEFRKVSMNPENHPAAMATSPVGPLWF
jgi:hypothetical protein